ncbi:host-nuclease inhibitor Gam family protein [Anaerosolibacter sp.]|uniref:host-nuclease inhibitor Gam family protein n=1 Tax=Anaerosolibacter sp. TaxID=1872527 RepID=UPI0039EF50FD
MLNQLQVFEIEELKNMTEDESHARFEIKDLDGVNWVFRKIRANMSKKAELEALAKTEIERIQSWLAGETKQIDDSVNFFEGLLMEYAIKQRAADPKFKCSTPYGKIGFRKQPVKWEYEEEILVENLKKAGLNDLVRTKEEPNKTEIKKKLKVVNGKAVTEDGEIIDGITITEQDEKIDIKVVE